MYWFVTISMFAIGVLISMRLDKYEFENTTDGGVVEFRSYFHSKLHDTSAMLAYLLKYAAYIMVVIGLFNWVLRG